MPVVLLLEVELLVEVPVEEVEGALAAASGEGSARLSACTPRVGTCLYSTYMLPILCLYFTYILPIKYRGKYSGASTRGGHCPYIEPSKYG